MQFVDGKATLTIYEASIENSGSYQLVASNLEGQTSTDCYVTVKEVAPAVKTVQPSIQLFLKDVSVFEKQQIRLDCIIVGLPEPEVIWLHNNNPVKESNDVKLFFHGDHCTLFIKEAFKEDSGHLNSAGEASSECTVTVTPLNITEAAIERSSVERAGIVASYMPPKFDKLLDDNFAIEGESCELQCSLDSGPLPEIKWYLNNKEIIFDDRVRAESREDGTLKLIIASARPDDKGVYTVKATNSTGVAKCFSHLIVKSSSKNGVDLHTPKAVEDKLICPTFKQLFADQCIGFEETAKFECIIVGKPTPKIKWYFNDQPVQGHDFLVSTSGDRQVLMIPKVTSINEGKISCIAENEAGRATCVAVLTLDSRGAPMTEEQFTTQEDSSGSSFVTMQKHITTTTSTKTSIFGDGTAPQTESFAASKQVDSSYQKIGDAAPQINEASKYEEFREMSNEPPQTFAQKMMNFTKNDTNEKHESIIANSGQICTGKPRKNIAPRFVSPLVGKIVDQGADVVLEGIVDGFPVPSIEVTKNGEELKNVEGLSEIAYSLNKVVIKLFNVATKEAGRYSVIAKNAAGSATSTADLVVKKSIFPPVFGRRLQAQVIKNGEKAIMDVEVTGMPEPKVNWFKDDQPFLASSNNYRLFQQGNCYKLIIEQGKF